MQRRALNEGWTFKQRDPKKSIEDERTTVNGWLPATVPGVVQSDLLAHGKIPDPFQGLNESLVQWVGEADWLYRCRFSWSPEDAAGEPVLCFGGLDTFATVWLNGQQILTSDNMFLTHRVPIQQSLIAGENELIVLFESPLRLGRAREAEHGKMPVWNGDASRVYVRKAQYHYGWDWGPCILTAGLWQPIWLETTTTRIAEIHCPVRVSDDLERAEFAVQVRIERAEAMPTAALRLSLYDPSGKLVGATSVEQPAETALHTFTVEQPRLWWPHGYGAQPLYRLVVTLLDGETAVEQQEQRLGVRRLRLLQEEFAGEEGTSFRFEVNNTPVFCGGANWIPADLMLPRVSDEHYRISLQQAADANMVMVRVWGGGIYENDIFYDLCDELGLLVWQDFLFACGMYPAHEAFQQSIRAEAETAIRRLRHHPSIALWCGNNEDYSIAASLQRPIAGPITDAFPARAIYEHLLPDVCARLDPDRPYWRGSPYSFTLKDDPHAGDRHIWSIWHQAMLPYQQYPSQAGRFISEFGLAAYPSGSAIAAMADPAERYPGSRTLDFHFKADDGVRRLNTYVSENLRLAADLESYAYTTQVIQAEALASAYRGWRRLFQPGEYGCSGALVWQLNDCWPCISWAIVDDRLIPKLAYYATRRALAPIALELGHEAETTSALWACNSTAETIRGVVQVWRWSLSGDLAGQEERVVVLPPHRTTPLESVDMAPDATHVLQARLLVQGTVISTASLWPEPLKYLTLPDPGIACERLDDDHILIAARAPAKSVWLESDAPVAWSDNGFDLFPGDPVTLIAPGLAKAMPHICSLYNLQSTTPV